MSVKYFPNRTHLLNASILSNFQSAPLSIQVRLFSWLTFFTIFHITWCIRMELWIFHSPHVSESILSLQTILSAILNELNPWFICVHDLNYGALPVLTHTFTHSRQCECKAHMRWRLFVFCLPPHFCFITACVDFVDMLSIEWCARKISGYAGRNEKFSHFLCRM